MKKIKYLINKVILWTYKSVFVCMTGNEGDCRTVQHTNVSRMVTVLRGDTQLFVPSSRKLTQRKHQEETDCAKDVSLSGGLLENSSSWWFPRGEKTRICSHVSGQAEGEPLLRDSFTCTCCTPTHHQD